MSQTYLREAEQHVEVERSQLSIAPHQCSYCEKVLIDVRQQHRVPDRSDPTGWLVENPEAGITLAEVMYGSQNGCDFFASLVSRAQIDARYHHAGNILDGCERNTCDHRLSYILRTAESQPIIRFYAEDVQIPSFELYARPADFSLFELIPIQLPPNLMPGSGLSLDRAKMWRRECDEKHQRCHSYRQDFAPRWLIDVGCSQTCVKLVTTSNDLSYRNYATLSYCWGGDQNSKTTKARLSAYSEGIDLETLPQTIVDAIRITRDLSIRYLWIDSFCIVQDDPDDKFLQIGEMHKIFRSASITIAAASTRAKASTDGFLELRERFRPFVIEVQLESDTKKEMLLSPVAIGIEVSKATLYKRGWTLQETHLATRILSFEDQGMRWCCLEAEHLDGGYMAPINERYLNPGALSMNEKSHPASWLDMVQTFGFRQLSVASDKLPAIAALAEDYSLRRHVGRYLPGMWESYLIPQCAWVVRNASRVAEYRAPTWSWASLQGLALYHTHVKESYWHELDVTCSVIRAETTPKSGLAPFGEVISGSLKVRGNVKRIVWVKQDDVYQDRPNGRGAEAPVTGDHHKIDQRFRLNIDFDSEWANGEHSFLCLELFRFPTSIAHEGQRVRGPMVYALALSETTAPNVYQRAGMVGVSIDLRALQWFDDDAEIRELTIA